MYFYKYIDFFLIFLIIEINCFSENLLFPHSLNNTKNKPYNILNKINTTDELNDLSFFSKELINSCALNLKKVPLALLKEKVKAQVIKASDSLNLPNPDEEICEINYSELCPDNWANFGDGENCLSPIDYMGPCEKKVSFKNATPTSKYKFSIECDVSWPCVGICIEDFSKECPYKWLLNEDICEAPKSYNGRCLKKKNFSSYSEAEKKLWGDECDVKWPCYDKNYDLNILCPIGWKINPNLKSCSAPDSYIGPCTTSLHLFDLTQKEKLSLSKKCNIEWPVHKKKEFDLNSLCPIGWKISHLESVTCDAPSSYNGPCEKKISFSYFSKEDKYDFSQKCDVQWPLLDEKYQNFDLPCPYNWVLVEEEENICISPVEYQGPCENIFSFKNYTKEMKSSWSSSCNTVFMNGSANNIDKVNKHRETKNLSKKKIFGINKQNNINSDISINNGPISYKGSLYEGEVLNADDETEYFPNKNTLKYKNKIIEIEGIGNMNDKNFVLTDEKIKDLILLKESSDDDVLRLTIDETIRDIKSKYFKESFSLFIEIKRRDNSYNNNKLEKIDNLKEVRKSYKNENEEDEEEKEKEKEDNYEYEDDIEKEKEDNYEYKDDIEKEKEKEDNYEYKDDNEKEKEKKKEKEKEDKYEYKDDIEKEKEKEDNHKYKNDNEKLKEKEKKKEKEDNYEYEDDIEKEKEKEDNYEYEDDIEKEKEDNYEYKDDNEKEKEKEKEKEDNHKYKDDNEKEKEDNYKYKDDNEKEIVKGYDYEDESKNEIENYFNESNKDEILYEDNIIETKNLYENYKIENDNFSYDGTCLEKDYTKCPVGWAQINNKECLAPKSYVKSFRKCSSILNIGNIVKNIYDVAHDMSFVSIDIEQRKKLEKECNINFPCKECERDYVRINCPLGWTDIEYGNCKAPDDYPLYLKELCNTEVNFKYATPLFKRNWSFLCKSDWPCFSACEKNYGSICPVGYKLINERVEKNSIKIHVCANEYWKDDDENDFSDKIKRNVCHVIEIYNSFILKKEIEKKCKVTWPCLNKCEENFYQSCPYNWLLKDNKCIAPYYYTPPKGCENSFDILSFNTFDKYLFSNRCFSPWPCKNSCQQDWSRICPDEWILKKKKINNNKNTRYFCKSSIKYKGKCTEEYDLTDFTFSQKQDFSFRCNVKWPCGHSLHHSKNWQKENIYNDLNFKKLNTLKFYNSYYSSYYLKYKNSFF